MSPLGNWFLMLDRIAMEKQSREKLNELGRMTIQNIGQDVETLSGGHRQSMTVARAITFGSNGYHENELTTALSVKEGHSLLELIINVKLRKLPIVLISHNMPHISR